MDRHERQAYEEQVDRRTAGPPNSLPDWLRDWLRQQCEKQEDLLRMQYPDDTLPPYLQRLLSAANPETDVGLLRRWKILGHGYIARDQNLQGRVSGEEKQKIMRQLLLREPEEVEVAGRVVEVTDRSLACMQQIGRHQLRIRELEEDLSAIQEKASELREDLDELEPGNREARTDLRRRLHELRQEMDLRLTEIGLQRKAIYAHLFTEDGAPADSVDDAPSWWDEIGPIEEVLLIEAAKNVGARRWAALGPAPDRPDQDRTPRRLEDYGFLTLLAESGQEMPSEPAAPFQLPLFQQFALRRAGAPPVWED